MVGHEGHPWQSSQAEECHQLGHSPGGGEAQKGEASSDVEAKTRKTGTLRVKVGGRFSGEMTEAAETIGIGFPQATMVAEVVMSVSYTHLTLPTIYSV